MGKSQTIHTQNDQKFFEIGQFIGKSVKTTTTPKGYRALSNPQEHRQGIVHWVQKKYLRRQASNKQLDSKHRRNMLGMDELIPTSAFREILKGVLHNSNYSPQELGRIDNLLNDVSTIRSRTAYVGFATSTEKMQHPTAKGTGYFAESSETASLHGTLDQERKKMILEAMQDAMNKKLPPEELVKMGIQTAIAFTLNHMYAPITAENVEPYSLRGGKRSSPLQKHSLINDRELLKRIHTDLGGKQDTINGETPSDSLRRPWNRGKSARSRSVSPRRITRRASMSKRDQSANPAVKPI